MYFKQHSVAEVSQILFQQLNEIGIWQSTLSGERKHFTNSLMLKKSQKNSETSHLLPPTQFKGKLKFFLILFF
jgi:hypothetical protein